METISIITQTPALIIRRFEPGDFDALFSYRSDPQTAQFQCYEPMSREEVSTFLKAFENKTFGQEGEWVQYAIVTKADNELVGDCAAFLSSAEGKTAEIGVSIHPAWQGRGIANEALAGLINWLFEKFEMQRIEAVVELENIVSIALLEKLGFQEVASIVPHTWKNKDPRLFAVYVLIR